MQMCTHMSSGFGTASDAMHVYVYMYMYTSTYAYVCTCISKYVLINNEFVSIHTNEYSLYIYAVFICIHTFTYDYLQCSTKWQQHVHVLYTVLHCKYICVKRIYTNEYMALHCKYIYVNVFEYSMYMNVYVCLYVYVCIYAYLYVHKYVHTRVTDLWCPNLEMQCYSCTNTYI